MLPVNTCKPQIASRPHELATIAAIKQLDCLSCCIKAKLLPNFSQEVGEEIAGFCCRAKKVKVMQQTYTHRTTTMAKTVANKP